MKTKKVLSLVFALLAIALTALTLRVTFGALDAKPVLVTPPDSARATADAVMQCICDGDDDSYQAAARLMYGNPDLGTDRAPKDEVGRLLWDAFRASLSYELVGDCYATDSGVAQDVTVTCLDFSSVTASLQERAQALLVERVEAAEDADTIYDDSGDYREDFVMAVLRDVTLDALEEDARNKEQTLTVNLVCKQGQWWVVPDQALLSVMIGGIAG